MYAWFENLSVGIKVALAPVLALLCLASVGVLSYLANASMSQSLDRLIGKTLPTISTVAALDARLRGIHAKVNQSLAWEGAGFKSEKIEALDKSILSDLAPYGKDLETAANDPNLEPTERDLFAPLLSHYGKYQKHVKDVLDIKVGMLGNAASFMTTMDMAYADITKAFDSLIQEGRTRSEAEGQQAQVLSAQNQFTIIGSIVAAIALTGVIAALMTRMIVVPLSTASRLANAVSQGDLCQRVGSTTSDATGQVLQALGNMSTKLSQVVSNIHQAAYQVKQASSEIAAGNDDLSQRTEQTAANLQRTATSLEQLTSTLRSNAQNARSADQLAQGAAQAAREGGNVVAEVMSSMDQLNVHANKIRDIIGVIDGIAFQTNILSLNAAVEAARAGEHGKGFAIVASEVRALAKRCGDAAKEIRGMIGTSVQYVNESVRKVQSASVSMEHIVETVQGLASAVQGISTATQEQSIGLTEINQAVTSMDIATQQNTALVEEAAAAAATLRNMADNLVGSIATFKTMA